MRSTSLGGSLLLLLYIILVLLLLLVLLLFAFARAARHHLPGDYLLAAQTEGLLDPRTSLSILLMRLLLLLNVRLKV